MKDYYGELIKIAAEDTEAAFKQAEVFVDEISEGITHLYEQQMLVTQMRQYLASKLGKPWPRIRGRDFPISAANIRASTANIPEVEAHLSSQERSHRIREAAIQLARSGHRRISPQEVLDYLDLRNQSLDAKHPLAVIGTVLSNMSDFQRTSTNDYEYIGVLDQNERRGMTVA